MSNGIDNLGNRSLRGGDPNKPARRVPTQKPTSNEEVLLPEEVFENWDAMKGFIQKELLQKLETQNYEDYADKNRFYQFVNDTFEADPSMKHLNPLDPLKKEQMHEFLYRDLYGVGGLEPYLRGEQTEDIVLNSFDKLFVYVGGKLTKVPNSPFHSDQEVVNFLSRILAAQGKTLNRSNPMENGTLADGSRLIALVPPVVKQPAFVIRKHNITSYSEEDYLKTGMFTREFLDDLKSWVQTDKTIILSGGTGSGKTTFLNFVSNLINFSDRICVIEDTPELHLQGENILYMQTVGHGARRNVIDKNSITIRDEVAAALRLRPDKIVVGECRGGEAFDMLQAVNTGHEGSMTTLHANSPNDAIKRLEAMAMQTGDQLPVEAIQDLIGSAVNVIIQVARKRGQAGRIVKAAYQIMHPLVYDVEKLKKQHSDNKLNGPQQIRDSVYTYPLWRWSTSDDKLVRLNDYVVPDYQ